MKKYDTNNQESYLLPYTVVPVFDDYIKIVENRNDIKSGDLRLHLAMHLYKYSLDEVFDEGEYFNPMYIKEDTIINEIDFLAKNISRKNRLYTEMSEKAKCTQQKTYLKKYKGEILEIEVGTDVILNKVIFKEVDEKTGFLIQDELHYIHSRREDTINHFGLYRENSSVPFVYCAFSKLDRQYLQNLPHFEGYAPERMLVMTRAFGLYNAPKNAMSTLYSESMNYYKHLKKFDICVTSVNKNLLFTAQSFLASSFLYIATIPANYEYINGLFAPRRKIEKSLSSNIQKAKTMPTPIMCLARGIGKTNVKKIEARANELPIYHITEKEYYDK